MRLLYKLKKLETPRYLFSIPTYDSADCITKKVNIEFYKKLLTFRNVLILIVDFLSLSR